jgi:methionyl-tRNA synthetase
VLRIVAALVHPVIPDATAKIWAQLGLKNIGKANPQQLKWGQLELGTKLGNVEAVFPRADKAAVQTMQEKEQQGVLGPTASAAAPTKTAGAPTAAADGKISIEDFTKIELRVGLVKAAEKVKGADKLLRLEVDIGSEVRQIVAGIALAYAPEKLIGRKVVIVANLQPRKLRGLESNGMIVAASVGDEGTPVLAGFLEDVPVGARLK